MRTRSNPVALMIATIIGLSVTSVSCSPDSTVPTQPATETAPTVVKAAQSLHDQYAWTGKYHNDALAYAMEKVNRSNKLSKFDKCKTGLAALKEFQKAFRKAGGNAVFDDLSITDGMCEAAGSLSNRVSSSVNFDPASISPVLDMSAAGSDFLNQILYQVDVAPSVDYLNLVVAKIERQAASTVDVLEASAVATTGSIATSSTNYWTGTDAGATGSQPAPYARSQNGSISRLEDFAPRFAVALSPRAKKIIKADVAAAVGILLKEWFMGEAAVAKACITAAAASLIAGIYAT